MTKRKKREKLISKIAIANELGGLIRQRMAYDWKQSKTIEQLKLLFRIHKLDQYITDMVPYTEHTFKPDEIQEYLKMHTELKSYVILDDLDMENIFVGIPFIQAGKAFLPQRLC